jgi:hypothetical protein
MDFLFPKPTFNPGWLWCLGMLFPVIGIIQISSDAAHADRYTYLPEIGLALAATGKAKAAICSATGSGS